MASSVGKVAVATAEPEDVRVPSEPTVKGEMVPSPVLVT